MAYHRKMDTTRHLKFCCAQSQVERAMECLIGSVQVYRGSWHRGVNLQLVRRMECFESRSVCFLCWVIFSPVSPGHAVTSTSGSSSPSPLRPSSPLPPLPLLPPGSEMYWSVPCLTPHRTVKRRRRHRRTAGRCLIRPRTSSGLAACL